MPKTSANCAIELAEGRQPRRGTQGSIVSAIPLQPLSKARHGQTSTASNSSQNGAAESVCVVLALVVVMSMVVMMATVVVTMVVVVMMAMVLVTMVDMVVMALVVIDFLFSKPALQHAVALLMPPRGLGGRKVAHSLNSVATVTSVPMHFFNFWMVLVEIRNDLQLRCGVLDRPRGVFQLLLDIVE